MEIIQQKQRDPPQIFKIVLTGGPCGGKTTGQARLSIFFENIGWKVYRVPETATLLLGGGVKFDQLSKKQATKFQENLLKTMMQLEKSFFDIVKKDEKSMESMPTVDKNKMQIRPSEENIQSFNSSNNCIPQKCLIICDRGTMDPAAYISDEEWHYLLKKNGWTTGFLRDNRYDQVVHMVTAANGAEDFYTCQGNAARHEGLEQARSIDQNTANVWVGHPYFDIIDNSTGFDAKILRLISVICRRMGIDTGESLKIQSQKRKYIVHNFSDENSEDLKKLPSNQVFTVVHDYLVSQSSYNNHNLKVKERSQARLRKRGQNNYYTYTYTIRRPEIKGQAVELKRQIPGKEYYLLLQTQKDKSHFTIYKTRRCFLWDNHYYRLDIYKNPCPKSCKGLVLLETYTTKNTGDIKLPPFLDIEQEVTGKPEYSMWNLSLKDNKNFNPDVLMSGMFESLSQDTLPKTS